MSSSNEMTSLEYELEEVTAERDRYEAALNEIADGPNRHDAVRSIKIAKKALGHRASP